MNAATNVFPINSSKGAKVVPERRAIAIAATDGSDEDYTGIVALCNDGTIWWLPEPGGHSGFGWVKMPPIPQE